MEQSESEVELMHTLTPQLTSELSAILTQETTWYQHTPREQAQAITSQLSSALITAVLQQQSTALLVSVISTSERLSQFGNIVEKMYSDATENSVLLTHLRRALFRAAGQRKPLTDSLLALLARANELIDQALLKFSEGAARVASAGLDTLAEAKFKSMLESNLIGVSVSDSNGVIVEANEEFARLIGYDLADVYAGIVNWESLTPPEYAEAELRAGHEIRSTGNCQPYEKEYLRRDGSRVPALVGVTALGWPMIQGYLGMAVDMSATRQAEAARRQAAEQESMLRAQDAILRELSTPLIPLSAGTVIMPLVGAIDTTRAFQILETLLQGIGEHQADIAILDITGVPLIDTQVAATLIRSAQAVKLLGAQIVLTGIRPEVAQTLVGLGVDLKTLVTRGTLQAGIDYALSNQRLLKWHNEIQK